MELTSQQIELRKLTASDGMYLTQAEANVENRIYTDSVYLGKGESIDNWREATEAEKVEWESAEKLRMQELIESYKNQTQD